MKECRTGITHQGGGEEKGERDEGGGLTFLVHAQRKCRDKRELFAWRNVYKQFKAIIVLV